MLAMKFARPVTLPPSRNFPRPRWAKFFSSMRATKLRNGHAKTVTAPGSNHVAAGGGRGVGGLITFRKDSGESAKVQNDACLGCHQRGIQTYWAASPHANRGLSCVNCHTLMEKTSDNTVGQAYRSHAILYNRAETEVCGQCHLQRRAQLMRSSHMPVREGKLTCTSCHNPHGHAQSGPAQTNERERKLLYLPHRAARAVSIRTSADG